MERVALFCGGRQRGEIALSPEGPRTRVRAAMADPGDGLYRAYLAGEGGELALGVLAPAGGGEIAVCRRLYSREVAGIGRPLRGEARRSFRFSEADWQETDDPARFFHDPFLSERLRRAGPCRWRRAEGVLYLALPAAAGKPFPLEALFCFARMERVAGTLCAVYAFRGETPVAPEGGKFFM